MANYKYVPHKAKLADVVSDAFGEFTSLGEEMRETADNMEGANMGHLPKCEMANEAADTLEQLQEPDLPEELGGEIEIEYALAIPTRKGRSPSRATRRDNAVQQLASIIDYIDGCIDAMSQDDSAGENYAIQEYRDELQDAIDNAEGIEFPGMYS